MVPKANSAFHLHRNNSFILSRSFPHYSHTCQRRLISNSIVDTHLALGNLGVGQLTQDLLQADSHLHQDRLFQEARTCLPRMWGSEYPAEQLLDDLENYRPLSFLQACAKLKVEVWTLSMGFRRTTVDQRSLDQLWQKVKLDGQVMSSRTAFTKWNSIADLFGGD
jgi:hypothetical protein